MKEESKVSGYVNAYEYDDVTRRTNCLSLIDYLDLYRLGVYNYSAGDKLVGLKTIGRPDEGIYYNMDSNEFKLVKIELADAEKYDYKYTVIKDLPTYKDLFNEIGTGLSKSQLSELNKKFKYNSEINDEKSIYLEYDLERTPHAYNVIWSTGKETQYDITLQLPKENGKIRIEGDEDTTDLLVNNDNITLEIQNSHPMLKYMLEYFLENKEKLSSIKKLNNGYLYNNTYYEKLDYLIEDFVEDLSNDDEEE